MLVTGSISFDTHPPCVGERRARRDYCPSSGETAEAYFGSGEGYTFWKYEFPELMRNLENGSLRQVEITF